MKEAVWILGHGLLGSEIESQLRANNDTNIFRVPSFSWNDPDALRSLFSSSVTRFSELVQKTGGHYRIFWTAGRGIMNSSEDEMQKETRNLALFIKILNAEESLAHARGVFVFASSAGGVYAGSQDDIITEKSAVAATTSYGRGKLEQEALIKELQQNHRSVCIARIANMYGPKQSRMKKQGLLTHISRCILTRKPIHIFVPFDTIRDYLHVRDAATDLLNASVLVQPGEVVTKIIASEEPATIATIIGLFRRITRQNPLLATGNSELGAVYPHRMRFSSTVLTKARSTKRTSLPEGIAETIAHERLQYAHSGMPSGE